MMTKSKEENSLAVQFLITRWEGIAQKFTALTQEIPDDRLNYRPADDVRTVGEIVRHVAFWNQYAADSLRGKPTDGTANELPAADYPTKAKVRKALEKSAHEAVAAMREQPPSQDQKTAELVIPFIEHIGEHYGQLVAYSRMLGIVPPASRG